MLVELFSRQRACEKKRSCANSKNEKGGKKVVEDMTVSDGVIRKYVNRTIEKLTVWG